MQGNLPANASGHMTFAMGNQALARSHKGPGIASYTIGLLSIWAIIGLIGGLAVLQIANGQAPEVLTEEHAIVFAFGVIAVVCVDLIAIGLGIYGAVDRASKKTFPLLGLVVNVAMVGLFIAALVFNPPTH